jgi:hypothetical protein
MFLVLLISWSKALRVLTRWALAMAVSYVAQILLIVGTRESGSMLWQALHPFNGSLLLTLVVVVLLLAIGSRMRRSSEGALNALIVGGS